MNSVDLVRHVRQFFEKHCQGLFVFGCSGGVDSSALLHLLHEAGCIGHIVHVDHGWRAESAEEAKILQERAASLGWPCTIVRLKAAPSDVNIEDWSRNERMAALSAAASALDATAIVLAHQADDQTEVVMKRFFEGASLMKFRGMRAVEKRGELTILRPLLSVRRADLVRFLQERKIPHFIDPTNTDTSFLRARMRLEMVPILEKSFGKGVFRSLLRVSEESSSLEDFVREECDRRFAIQKADGAAFVSAPDGAPPFLVGAVIEKVREHLQLPSPSRSVVDGIVRAFCGRPSGARSFFVGEGGFFVESRFFAAFQRRPPPIEEFLCETASGQCRTGCWTVSWRPSVAQPCSPPDWRALFAKKAVSWYIPDQPFRICRVSDRRGRAAERKFVALRPFVPAVAQAFALVADPLAGYTIPLEPGSRCYEVTVSSK